MGSYSTYSKEDLEALKGHYYDDWNFGSGKDSSLKFLEEIEAELRARANNPMFDGLHWQAADDPPKRPNIGDAYYDTQQQAAFVWTGSQWVQLAGTM